ncbi:SIR2 family protein [Treponema sp.]|uniref:SIR2 family protein n=1 Tax=Treponema sp. TaxID=166 RepID=UPI0025E44736|nr:SIR2 family protein [Treponema sp.]MBR4321807.1 SIR2 family protein [Treponema sp.]
MKENYSAIIDDIHNASDHNNLTFFVGAGVSRCSGTKGWGELIEEISFKLNGKSQKNISSDDYLGIAEAFYHYSESEYDNYLRENFYNITEKPNRIHDLFFKFHPASFITTNFDDLLERAAVKNCKTYISVSKEDEIALVNGEHFIIKAHGDYKSGNIVFKDSDYLNYSSEHKLVDTLIKSVFASNLVIFIGYRLQDYTIRYILNWVHNCLKDKFKPIFIYTDNKKLSKSNIAYQTSRGLRIVDWHNFYKRNEKKGDFIERYLKVLNSFLIDKVKTFSNTNDKENFSLLYEKLSPLDSFFALRHEDIKKILRYYVDIDTSGRIIEIPSQPSILKSFIDYTERRKKNKSIPRDDLPKFNTLCSIFKKAGVFYTVRNGKQIDFERDYIADKDIILFDYKKMELYTQKTYTSLENNYKKAYFLFLLGKFVAAYTLYQTIIYEAFKTKQYLIYYLAQKNVFNMHELKSYNSFLYDFNETTNLPEHEDDIFAELPNNFKFKYSIFSNMYNSNYLYKNTYKANLIANKMENTNSTNTVEIGETSFWQGNTFIYNSLHFVIGNYLLTDEFSEFKNPIKMLLEQQLFQYSEVGKKPLSRVPFSNHKNTPIVFGEIDFFCFIKYFSQKELETAFNKYNINKLEITHDDLINKAIKNLFAFYVDILISTNNLPLMKNHCKKLAVCLELLCHVVVSKKTVEYVTNVLFNYTFYEIPFTLRWKFINYQDENGTVNTKTRNTLLCFITKGIEERKEITKTKTIVNTTNDLDYTVFSEFLKKNNSPSIIKLDTIVHSILEDCPNYPINELLYYYPIVNKGNKKRIRILATEKLKAKFDVGILINLVHCGEKISSEEVLEIHHYLEENIENNKTRLLDSDQEYVLINIGFLCFKGELQKKDFMKYLGTNDLFDFLVSPESFQQNKFNIRWLTDSFNSVNKYLSNNLNTKKIIQNVLVGIIKTNKCSFADKKQIMDLYFKYYV